MIDKADAVDIARRFATNIELNIGELLNISFRSAAETMMGVTAPQDTSEMIKDRWFVLFDISDAAKLHTEEDDFCDAIEDILITVEAETGIARHVPPIGIR